MSNKDSIHAEAIELLDLVSKLTPMDAEGQIICRTIMESLNAITNRVYNLLDSPHRPNFLQLQDILDSLRGEIKQLKITIEDSPEKNLLWRNIQNGLNFQPVGQVMLGDANSYSLIPSGTHLTATKSDDTDQQLILTSHDGYKFIVLEDGFPSGGIAIDTFDVDPKAKMPEKSEFDEEEEKNNEISYKDFMSFDTVSVRLNGPCLLDQNNHSVSIPNSTILTKQGGVAPLVELNLQSDAGYDFRINYKNYPPEGLSGNVID